MATEISLDLINQLQVSLRKEAQLSSFDPVSDYSDSSFPSLPAAAEAISELDASAPYLRCRNCKGKLLRGIDSLICVFCGEQQRTSDNPPDPIKFTSTSGYKWFLSSLNLDGSEMVEPLKETNESSRGVNTPVVKGIAVSKFLDLEIQWSAREEKSIGSGSGDGQSVQNRNPLNLGGINLDDFFVEGRGDFSKVDPPAESKPAEDDFNDPRSLSLFDSVKSSGVVGSQQNENVGLFKGKDVEKNVSSEKHENLSLFVGRDAKESVSLAEQGNFGFFEANAARQSFKEDENLSLFEGKDAQRTSSSKDNESFGFFEDKDAQRNSSSKEDGNLSLFEGKDGQRTSSSKDDKSFGFFEGKDAPTISSSKDDESFGFSEGKDAQRISSSKDDESFGFFDGKDGQRNSSSKDDESFGLFEGTPSSHPGLKSFDNKIVASSSDWDSDFQSADRNLSQEKTSGDPFVSSPVDLSAHMDSVFGSGKDLLYAKPTDSSTAYVSKAGDWLQDDLFGNVTGEAQNNGSAVHGKNKGQIVGGNENSSMDIDWIGDDLWQTNEKKPAEKTTTDDNDDDDDDWNDFAGSANSKTPNNPLSQTMGSSHGNVVEHSEYKKQNIDISKGLQDPEILVPKDNNNTQDSKWSSLFKKKEDNNNNNNTTPEMLDEREKERIFILKPRSNSSSPDSHLMRNSSSFFLSEIKRKLKHAIKKEQQQQLQFPKNVPTKDHFFLERRMSKKKSLQEEDDEKKQRVSNIYIEAKKHLSEMLNNGETDTKSKQQVERSLGRILSFPEYLSPLSSPGRRWEQTSTTSHRKSSSPDFVNLVNIKKETLANPPEDINDDIHKNKETESSIESLKPISSETTKDIEDDVMVIKEIDIVPEEPSSTLEILQDEQRDSTISKQKNSNVEESQAPVSSSSVASSPSHCLAKTENGQEWSSPISVLEPLFVEDDISPAKMRSGETQIQPWCIHFDEKESTSREDSNQNITTTSDKELVFNYITSILEAIDSNLEDLYLKAQFSDQLLEPSLISNIPFNPNQLCPNHELLFDCINEVIMELCCDPPPWFSKTRVFSTVKSIAREVQEAVYWHLLPLPLPHALDQIVKKDLAKGGNWLDIRCEIDWIGFEISELVIDELLEELIPVRAHICKV